MSNASKDNEYPTIADLFCLLDGWRHLPNYQLERRADVFFALFLPEVLEKRCGITIKRPLIPEFPIAKNEKDGKHKQADYFVLSENQRQGILVELKTDNASIVSGHGIKQLKMLCAVASKGPRDLIEDVIWLAQNTNNSKPTRQKYVHLLSHLRALNLVKFNTNLYDTAFAKNSIGITKMLREVKPKEWVCTKKCPTLEIVYILPKELPEGEIKNSMHRSVRLIYFKEFADAIEKGEEEGIRSLFAKRLREWAANDAGSPNPKDWPSC